MIKFFRRIRYDLMEKNKTGKYFKYAIGEIVLVVIGILIALSINNWNENLKNQRKEKTVLKEIHNEFLSNRYQLDTVSYYHRRALKSSNDLIAMFPIDSKKDNLDSIAKYLLNSSQTWTFNPSQGSVNGLVNSSSMDIIQNDELRGLLVSWQDLVLDYQEDELMGRTVIYENFDQLITGKLDFNFDLSDNRNDLKILESLDLEHVMHLRKGSLENILNDGQYQTIKKDIDRIIELSDPNNQ